jgi:hypothetical protein
MTVLSTHRYNTYKATPGPYKRDTSPKKILTPSMKNNLLTPFAKSTITIKPVIVPSKRKIVVFGKEFEVEMPEEYDIYEGLRKWYPGLYNIVLIEDKINREKDQYEEDDYEEMWAEFDYMEALQDY